MQNQGACPAKYDRIIAARNDRSSTLTVGLELEMMFATLGSNIADPHPGAGDVYRGFLVDSGDSSDHYDEGFDTWLVEHLEDNMPVGMNIRPEAIDDGPLQGHRTWRVVHDGSVYYEPVNRDSNYNEAGSWYDWVSREITSEVLDTRNEWKCGMKIDAVCRAIRKARVHLNDTTGVHVHVGRGEETFSLLTMKKFITLLWRK